MTALRNLCTPYIRFRMLVTIALVMLATGCYLPARFDAEISLSRFGAYDIKFQGYMAEINLFDQLKKNKITPEEEKKKGATLKKDFERDSSTKSFEYFKQGFFKVVWQKSGDILKTGMVVFFRRNENILSISYVKKKSQITILAAPIGPERAKTLINMGLNMQGQLRIRTDANVVSNNATSQGVPKNPRSPQEKLYTWDIKSVSDPSPRLIATLSRPCQ